VRLYDVIMKWMAIQLAMLSVAFGAAAQTGTTPKSNVELCNSALASYRDSQARVMALGATYFDRTTSKKIPEAALTLQEIQNELSASAVAIQYMQLGGCALPTPAPDLHRAGQDQYACGVVPPAGSGVAAKGAETDACQRLKERMNDVRAGKP
jgi:hypothetical protein